MYISICFGETINTVSSVTISNTIGSIVHNVIKIIINIGIRILNLSLYKYYYLSGYLEYCHVCNRIWVSI